jgi:hypothetical protein
MGTIKEAKQREQKRLLTCWLNFILSQGGQVESIENNSKSEKAEVKCKD